MRTVHIVVRVPRGWLDVPSQEVNEMLREVTEESLSLGEDHGCGEESGRLSLRLDSELLEQVRAHAGVARNAELIRRVIAAFRPLLKEVPTNVADDTLVACCTGCGVQFLATPWSNAQPGKFIYTWCPRCRSERDVRIVTGVGTDVRE
jgi:hypothetical protein